MSFKTLLISVLLSVAPLTCHTTVVQECPSVKVDAVRLPDLSIARSGHHTFYVNGEAVVIGGHTDGFVPTQTAEYLKDGQWHTLSTVYTHDQGLAIAMKNGRILIAGGHEKDLGIGQQFSVELYDPATHTFEGYGCLGRKRCFADAVELDSGRVIISGNWYQDDGIEEYYGSNLFRNVKEVTQHRSQPYIFRTARNNAMLFSTCDIYDEPFDSIVADQLQGDSFAIPWFGQWIPLHNKLMPHSANAFIGDEAKELYSYLFPVIGTDGQWAIAKTDGKEVSLLKTDYPVPMRSRWDEIQWFSSIVSDTLRQKAYMLGYDNERLQGNQNARLYVLAIGYASTPAKLTLHYTEPLADIGLCQPVLTPEGNLLMAGGFWLNNFQPYRSAVLLITGEKPLDDDNMAMIAAIAALLTVVVVLAVIAFVANFRRRRKIFTASMINASDDAASRISVVDEQTYQRLCRLMEDEKLYLDSDLKLQDVAVRLGTNRTYVSNCIRNHGDQTFTQLVSNYRIDYAKDMLQRHSYMKVNEVAIASGFTTDVSFFRTFKSVTGMTPTEWRAQQMTP